MGVMDSIFEKAKKLNKKIVLPEGEDERMLVAARDAKAEGLVTPIFVGDKNKIYSAAKNFNVKIDGIEIVEPKSSPNLDAYINEYYELRKQKGMILDQAKEIILTPLFFAAMMVRKDLADGMIAGAINTTANVVKSCIHIIQPASGIKTISSSFLMIVPNCTYGNNGAFIYADGGVVPRPTAEQLADIAIASAQTCEKLMNVTPRIAFLSFSTKGSAQDESLTHVIEGVKILKQKRPDIIADGEFQGDAAIIPAIAKKKAPDSPIQGDANILIFPDLNAGNIAYKLTERLAKAEAYGPLLQGLNKPANDLSRGCKASDIKNIMAITAVRK